MSEINVVSRTQIINVEPTSSAISIINAGPAGPGGAIGTSTGTIILPGTTPPLPSDGAVGNYWLDQTADILYGPKKTVAPVWPIALYGAQTPPALLGENRRTTQGMPHSTSILPVNITLDAITRLRVDFNLHVTVPTSSVWVYECQIDGTNVGRFCSPLRDSGLLINASVTIPSVSIGQHTVKCYPWRASGPSGSPAYYTDQFLPGYLSVYKDRA